MSKREVVDPTPGLAGGPQPSPPGVSDGTHPPVKTIEDETTPAPKPGEELDGEGLLTPREAGTPGGVPGRS